MVESHYWHNLELAALRDVYLPAEDSELLANEAWKHVFGRVLEIGTGSGIIAIACAQKLEVREVVATDISESAIKCAGANAKKHGLKIRLYRGNLFSALPKGIGKFNAILFNPPYLPTNASEKVHGKLNFALDGGKEGISTAGKFLQGAGKYLEDGGMVLMIASTAQNLEKLSQIAENAGFSHGVCGTHNLFFEQLQVWLLRKTPQQAAKTAKKAGGTAPKKKAAKNGKKKK